MSRLLPVLVAGLLLAGCGFLDQGNVFDLAVGTCFDDGDLAAGATEVSGVPIVDCSEPHDNEVYATFDMTNADYPGFTETEQIAAGGCIDRFDAFVGIPYADSVLDVTYLFPTEQTWSDGDREVVCAVYRIDGERVTGTLEGSGI